MSFILEALKKSEQKRQEGEIPGLETRHRQVIESRSGRLRWIWILAPILIINAGVLFWLIGPRPLVDKKPAVASSRPAVDKPADLSKPDKYSPPSPAQVVQRDPAPPLAVPVESTAKVPEQLPEKTQAEEPVAEVPVKTGAGNRVYTLAELPLQIRRDIPEIHMSLHAFNRDDPAASLVRINGQILREGSQLANKFSLEKITEDGAIFSYQGYRFLIPRKGVDG